MSGSLTDRFAMAFGAGLCAMALATATWASVARYTHEAPVPFHFVGYFAVAMACLGFLLAENFVVRILGLLVAALFGEHGDRT